MPHCDPEVLALRAVGEPAGDARDDRHLANCPRCQAELDELTAVVTTARSVEPEDRPAPPPADVWRAVAADTAVTPGGVGAPTPPAADPVPAVAEPVVVALPERRRRGGSWAVAAVAAAVGVLVGSVGAAAVLRPAADSRGSLVASAVLDPLNGSAAYGDAQVTEGTDGELVTVDVTGLPAPEGFYEVWLLDSSATKLVALGTLSPGKPGVFPVPSGVSLADYPIVDVSLEPLDGDPGHSADSKVRGTLAI